MSSRARTAIEPSLTLGAVFGPGHVFSPRASHTPYGWLPRDPAVLDFLTGGQLAVAGDLPVRCSRAVCTPRVLRLLESAGLEVSAPLETYEGEADYLEGLLAPGRRIVVQHLHPPGEIPADRYWIPPELLARLNNKANLAELAPPGHVPARRVEPAEAIPGAKLPVVVKAASDRSSGAGVDVVICTRPEDLAHAAAYFAGTGQVVLEELVDVVSNFCVQFAITADGRLVYLGSGEQVVDAAGRYLGNWIGPQDEVPETAVEVGWAIVERGRELGYRGIAGFDVVVTRDGRTLAIDLNFRVNGCTVGMLLHAGLAQAMGAPVARFRSWQAPAGVDLFAVAAAAVERGDLVPLAAYDPEAEPQREAPARLSGLLVGASREEVLARERRLAAEGLP
jgi:hypothetical protein